MNLFPTSPLDRIEPAEPFVHATQWEQFRSQFRSSRSRKSGYRNCLQASDALNSGSSSWSDLPGSHESSRSVDAFTIAMGTDVQNLDSTNVDACFCDTSIDFLGEIIPTLSTVAHVEFTTSETESESNYDLELGLLESVQEIAIALARQTPSRVSQSTPTT